MANRRELTFSSLDEVMPDVERLLAGHTTVGRWTLGQILHHLAKPVRYLVDAAASPVESTPEQEEARRRFFAASRFPEGTEAPTFLVPGANLDARKEAESLREVLERFASASGPFFAHPILG